MKKIILMSCAAVLLFSCGKEDRVKKSALPDNSVMQEILAENTVGDRVFASYREQSGNWKSGVIDPATGDLDPNFPDIVPVKNIPCGVGVFDGIGITGEGLMLATNNQSVYASVYFGNVQQTQIFISSILDPLIGPSLEELNAIQMHPICRIPNFTEHLKDVEAIAFPPPVSFPPPVPPVTEARGVAAWLQATHKVYAVSDLNVLYVYSFQANALGLDGNIANTCGQLMTPILNLNNLNSNGNFKISLTERNLFIYDVTTGDIHAYRHGSGNSVVPDNSYFGTSNTGNIGNAKFSSSGCIASNSGIAIVGQLDNNNSTIGYSGQTETYVYYAAQNCQYSDFWTELNNNNYNIDHTVNNSFCTGTMQGYRNLLDMTAANTAAYDVTQP